MHKHITTCVNNMNTQNIDTKYTELILLNIRMHKHITTCVTNMNTQNGCLEYTEWLSRIHRMIAWNTQNININTEIGRNGKCDFQKNGWLVYNAQNDVVYVRGAHCYVHCGARYNLPCHTVLNVLRVHELTKFVDYKGEIRASDG